MRWCGFDDVRVHGEIFLWLSTPESCTMHAQRILRRCLASVLDPENPGQPVRQVNFSRRAGLAPAYRMKQRLRINHVIRVNDIP